MRKEVEIVNKLGLHARPAALFVRCVIRFKSTITIWKGEENFLAASLLEVLTANLAPVSFSRRLAPMSKRHLTSLKRYSCVFAMKNAIAFTPIEIRMRDFAGLVSQVEQEAAIAFGTAALCARNTRWLPTSTPRTSKSAEKSEASRIYISRKSTGRVSRNEMIFTGGAVLGFILSSISRVRVVGNDAHHALMPRIGQRFVEEELGRGVYLNFSYRQLGLYATHARAARRQQS